MLIDIVFYSLAAVVVAGAVACARARDLVRASVALFAVLFGAAGLLALRKFELPAAVLAFVGVAAAVAILVVAVSVSRRPDDARPGPWAIFGGAGFFLLLTAVSLAYGRWRREAEPVRAGGFLIRAGEDELTVVVPEGRARQVEARFVPADAAGRVFAVRAPIEGREARLRLAERPPGRGRWEVRLVNPDGPWVPGPPMPARRGSAESATDALSGRHLLAFEILGAILLVSLVAAGLILRRGP